MGSRDEAPSVALSKLEAAARHNRVLLHALQTCHPVMHNDRKLRPFMYTIQRNRGHEAPKNPKE